MTQICNHINPCRVYYMNVIKHIVIKFRKWTKKKSGHKKNRNAVHPNILLVVVSNRKRNSIELPHKSTPNEIEKKYLEVSKILTRKLLEILMRKFLISTNQRQTVLVSRDWRFKYYINRIFCDLFFLNVEYNLKILK